MERSYIVVCPHCKDREEIRPSDFHYEFGGLKRLALIHKDHALIIDADQSFSIRSAYITSFIGVIGQPTVFKGYRVLTDVVLTKSFEFVSVWPDKRIIDVRACPDCIPHLRDVLDAVIANLKPCEESSSRYAISTSSGLLLFAIRRPHLALFGLIDTYDANKELWLEAIADIYQDSPPSTQALAMMVKYITPRITSKPTGSHIYKMRAILFYGDQSL